MELEIIQKPSPHFSERQNLIPDIICCHQTGGSITSCINWFTNPDSKVSGHFAVSKKGEVYQFVSLDKAAWCNGNKYKNADSNSYNYYQKSLNDIVKQRKTNANFYTVSIEFENDKTGVLTIPQYDKGLKLILFIISELKRLYNLNYSADRLHFIGHYEISPVNKVNCPGIDFPFNTYLKDINKCLIEKALANSSLLNAEKESEVFCSDDFQDNITPDLFTAKQTLQKKRLKIHNKKQKHTIYSTIK